MIARHLAVMHVMQPFQLLYLSASFIRLHCTLPQVAHVQCHWHMKATKRNAHEPYIHVLYAQSKLKYND